MGGLIIRSALPHMESIKHLFSTYISLSSPHLGYACNPNKLVGAGFKY